MSTLSELTSKADYIASKNSHLKSHWRTYKNSLTQAITQLNVQINHAFIYGEEQDLRFTLFNHFIISIHLSDDFYSQELVYSLNMAHGDEQPDFRTFSHATLNEQGWVDSTVDIKDKRAVLEHYLNKISAIYDCLFHSLETNQPVYPALEKLLTRQ
ncbi:formate hydrogenlyase [Pantoea agglomerans]|uniref:formate hydrogenlyase n=1 Tax=Enterobacter agglomerans TaxID=549 RepID=UPI00057F9EBC|nr:formate hydrogenlyase [Pantoea agglomerans]KIC84998.1 formate hydrogenlyase [Pantoea agglomerans]MBA5701667.1 formate hydrogenlyase [Pantoea agglomerans]SUB19319.1 Formate hydrogenlyase regulatory protein hycA [Pantoea agglomerans]